jgi:protein tyrosine phosphatase (PTP) superfamily phosphohydrolase (DUF442 family)
LAHTRVPDRSLAPTASFIALLCASALIAACGGSRQASKPDAEAPAAATPTVTTAPIGNAAAPVAIAPPTMADMKPRDFAGIHNVVAFHDGYYSGSVPEGAEGFETLHAMGIRTIISVDGAEPDVEAAQRLGMRYIHLPIGYSGFDEERRLQLTRATRDAMAQGPVYIHCHHGKHRSAGAAATVTATLGWSTPEAGVERMKVSGTSPSYKGLYACALDATVLSAAKIDAVPADFPSVAPTPTFVKAMVDIDEIDTHLKYIEKAGWITPADHPDLVPAAEAGRMADLLRQLVSSDYTQRQPPEFASIMQRNSDEAKALEDMLASSARATRDPAALAAKSAQLKLIVQSCKDCHVKYRD